MTVPGDLPEVWAEKVGSMKIVCEWQVVIGYGMWHVESQIGKFDLICFHLDLILNHHHLASRLSTPLPTKCSPVSANSNFRPISPTVCWEQLKQKTLSCKSQTSSTRLSSGSKANLTRRTHRRSVKEKFRWGKWWWVALKNCRCLMVLTQCRNFMFKPWEVLSRRKPYSSPPWSFGF